jgi:hypothetical protein
MGSDPLSEALQSFRHSAFKLETRQQTAIGEEAERLAAFREHRPRPDRSVATTPYLQWVARATLDGKPWVRVRIVEYPLTEYTRYQVVGYQESAAAGERIFIVDRARDPLLDSLHQDFWLFDEGSRTELALLLLYTPEGGYAGCRPASPAELRQLRQARETVLSLATPLNEFIAEREREGIEAA